MRAGKNRMPSLPGILPRARCVHHQPFACSQPYRAGRGASMACIKGCSVLSMKKPK